MSQFKFIALSTTNRIKISFGTAVGVADIITCNKFFGDQLRGVDSVGVENCYLPLTRPVAVNTAGTTAQPMIIITDSQYAMGRQVILLIHTTTTTI